MIYELRTYQLRMGALPTYLDLAENKLLPALAEHGINPVGFWCTEIGTLNEVVHLWAYEDLNDRQQKWAKWFQDPRRAEYMKTLAQVIMSQNNKILKPTTFSGLK
jgi:hypothetical protein